MEAERKVFTSWHCTFYQCLTADCSPFGLLHIHNLNKIGETHFGMCFCQSDQGLQLPGVGTHCSFGTTNLPHVCITKNSKQPEGGGVGMTYQHRLVQELGQLLQLTLVE